MKGNIIPGSPEYELKSTINVKDIFTQNDLGIFTSKEDGSYSLNLPNGSNLLFTVETPGMETQSAQVSLPVASAAKPYRQTISYEQGKLKILNYFDEPANEDTYLQYLNVIEQKARLDVNEVSTETTPLAVTTNNPQPEDNKKSSGEKTNLGSSSQASTNTKKGLDNKELAKIAREDADELNQQAGQLMRDYAAANEIASKQKADAALKTEAANTALTEAANISDETERQIALDKATKLKEEADSDAALALKI
jgi:hypothetical protein